MQTATINTGCKNAGREQSTNIGRVKKLCLKALQTVQKGNVRMPVFLKSLPTKPISVKNYIVKLPTSS